MLLMLNMDYSTPPGSPGSLDPPLPSKGYKPVQSYQSRLYQDNLREVASGAIGNKRQTKALVSHINADVAALMCMLVANEQLSNPPKIVYNSLDDMDHKCKKHILDKMMEYAQITDLVRLRNHDWNVNTMKNFVSMDEYQDVLTVAKADMNRKYEKL